MEKPADVQYPIHDLLRRRWSPRAFADRPVAPEVLRSLLEAARWAPSSSNAQPWYFIVATHDSREEFDLLLSCLVEGNAAWAKDVPVLMISVAKLTFDNGKPNRHAYYDLGQAAADLTIEATARGLFVHQMAGIHVDKARAALEIPEGFDPVAAIALGYPGDPENLPEPHRQRELAQRSRKPVDSFVFNGHWGHPSPLFK
jgi:nitroreductase